MEWRKLHKVKFNGPHCLPNIVWVIKWRRIRWAGHIAHMGESRGLYTILVGRSEGKRTPRRPRHRWENNVKMDLQEMGCGGIDWIHLAQDRGRWWAPVNAVMNLRVS